VSYTKPNHPANADEVAANFARLLHVLEADAAAGSEPEITRLLRITIKSILDSRGATAGRAKGADAMHGADPHVSFRS
jgi:hypothetical protein